MPTTSPSLQLWLEQTILQQQRGLPPERGRVPRVCAPPYRLHQVLRVPEGLADPDGVRPAPLL